MDSQKNRKKTRKLLYQLLFNKCFQKVDFNDFIDNFYTEVFSFTKDDKYLKSMLDIIEKKEAFFIKIIKKYSKKFDFEKMNIENVIPIYISLAEIFYFEEEIPIKVSVNEAVELAKIYSDESAKKIVNWVLQKVINDYKTLKKEEKNFDFSKDFSIFK